MGKKRKSNPLPVIAVLLIAIAIFSAWGYQTAGWQGWFTPATPSLSPSTQPTADRDLRIATWNIRQLGARSSTDIVRVARLITDNQFDIVAIQEIHQDGRGLDALLNQLGHPWRSTRLGEKSRGGERLSFIYRGDRVVELKPAADLSGAYNDVFERVPYSAAFKAGNFDFQLVTVHLSWSDTDQRTQEMQTLAHLVSQKLDGNEADIILLGDFNEQKSKANLHYLQAAGWRTVTVEPTNLGSREIYDHILFNPASTREYVSRTGVIRFDETLYAGNDEAAGNALSDHRPVYADFRTTLPDDD